MTGKWGSRTEINTLIWLPWHMLLFTLLMKEEYLNRNRYMFLLPKAALYTGMILNHGSKKTKAREFAGNILMLRLSVELLESADLSQY